MNRRASRSCMSFSVRPPPCMSSGLYRLEEGVRHASSCSLPLPCSLFPLVLCLASFVRVQGWQTLLAACGERLQRGQSALRPSGEGLAGGVRALRSRCRGSGSRCKASPHARRPLIRLAKPRLHRRMAPCNGGQGRWRCVRDRSAALQSLAACGVEHSTACPGRACWSSGPRTSAAGLSIRGDKNQSIQCWREPRHTSRNPRFRRWP
jgi:hypothetical protein